MSSILRRTAAALACATALTSGVLLGGGTANAATYAGDLSQLGHLKPYCEKTTYNWINLKEAVSASPSDAFNPYTWRCRAYYMSEPIDMNKACRYYYGSRAYAVVENKGWAWGAWKCYR